MLDALGPFASHESDPLRVGFGVTPNKLNGRGFLHAGIITTFADVAIGHGLAAIAGDGARYVTIGRSCELLGTASIGDWVEATVSLTKTGGRVLSGSIVFSRSGRVIATAHALFAPARSTN